MSECYKINDYAKIINVLEGTDYNLNTGTPFKSSVIRHPSAEEPLIFMTPKKLFVDPREGLREHQDYLVRLLIKHEIILPDDE